jgi:hypothetical protein
LNGIAVRERSHWRWQLVAKDHTCAIGVPWTLIENPVLAMPVRPEGRLSFRQFLRLVRENTLGTYPPEAFDDEIIAGRLLWRRISTENGATQRTTQISMIWRCRR